MRELSARMIEAVLEGEGLRGVAELAAAEAGGPVAIVLPARGLAARAPGDGDLNGLAEYTRARVADASPAAPQRSPTRRRSRRAASESAGALARRRRGGRGDGAERSRRSPASGGAGRARRSGGRGRP